MSLRGDGLCRRVNDDNHIPSRYQKRYFREQSDCKMIQILVFWKYLEKKDMLQSFQQVIFLRMLRYLLVITTFAIHSNKKRGAVWWHFIYLA